MTTRTAPGHDSTTDLPGSEVNTATNVLFSHGFGKVFTSVGASFDSMQWAEEEIETARRRHPAHADRIHHSFLLLSANPDLTRLADSETVYRAHCRELLDRVAAGADTRPGTAAEVCCALLHTSLLTPLTSAATGLCLRMWQAAGLPEIPGFAEAGRHHEALEGSLIDEHERLARRKLTVPGRRLGAIRCSGRHNNQDVDCVYAPTGRLAIEL
ncbi:hypothetical protein [Saccharothrix syringae]|uniref:Uncharacterized protein n=1 Tax=Saccharothrix syringae TaxID=103733 RepID=A0A5Q0H407_SACSY|nr:hypothetical protein [Saccharothrix syringae]QFZ20540.1 hypothetical protein EKG83_26820 [Saccharothrix syringae]